MKTFIWMHLLNRKKHIFTFIVLLLTSILIYCTLFRMINNLNLFHIFSLSLIFNAEFFRSVSDDILRKSLEIIYSVPKGFKIHYKFIFIKSVLYGLLFQIIVFIDRFTYKGNTRLLFFRLFLLMTIILIANVNGIKIYFILKSSYRILLLITNIIITSIIGLVIFSLNLTSSILFSLVISILLYVAWYFYLSKFRVKEKIIIRSVRG